MQFFVAFHLNAFSSRLPEIVTLYTHVLAHLKGNEATSGFWHIIKRIKAWNYSIIFCSV